MSKLQWVHELSIHDKHHHLINNVDTVLLDIDGVLIHTNVPIPGSVDTIWKLRQLGKNIAFVTNNSTLTLDQLMQNLHPFEAKPEEIVTPNVSLIAYLRRIDYNRDIYAVAGNYTKQLLRENSFKVFEFKDIQPTDLEEGLESMKKLSLKALELCKNVGIVYLDVDYNCHHKALQVAQVLLTGLGSDVQLLCGGLDEKAPFDEMMGCLLANYYITGIEKVCNKPAITMGKPGPAITDFVLSTFEVTDPSRVLMIGDNVKTDIAFGLESGFKTCLVLTGHTSKGQVEEWTHEEAHKPHFVAPSLKHIYEFTF